MTGPDLESISGRDHVRRIEELAVQKNYVTIHRVGATKGMFMKTIQLIYNEIEDSSLVCEAVAGSREAFGELVSRHHRIVRTVLWRVLGDESEVEDVAQEVFMSALAGVADFRQQSSFQTWLLSIARNKAITILRKRQSEPGKAVNGLEHLIVQHQMESMLAGSVETPTLDALRWCIDQLSEDHQRLVNDIYFEGRSAAQVARDRDQAKNPIRMRLMRIRKALSGCIKKKTR